MDKNLTDTTVKQFEVGLGSYNESSELGEKKLLTRRSRAVRRSGARAKGQDYSGRLPRRDGYRF